MRDQRHYILYMHCKKGGSKNKIKTLNLRENVLKTSEIICPCSKIISLDKIS